MSFLDGEVYAKIDNPAKRIAIITTDYTEKDPHYEQIIQDINLIKKMLKNLGFPEKRVLLLKNKARNVIISKTSMHCTFDAPLNDGYIMMFNLTYKIDDNNFRAGQSCYTSYDIHEIFTVNNLYEWAGKPKLIFNQSSMLQPKSKNASNLHFDSPSGKTIEVPINMDIFESFSSCEDSYGDENGSFYIQALCETINHHIANKTIGTKDITDLMYEVHEKIHEKASAKTKTGPQTPFYKTTLVKNFVFPI